MKAKLFQQNHCEVCGELLIYIEHYEFDGSEQGSFEPYWECLNGCAYPESKDEELTPAELAERGKVETQTEFGIVSVDQDKGEIIL